MEPSPRLALTIGEMAGRGWAIRAVCDRCCTYMWTDVRTPIAMSGPDTFFWGRPGRCKVMHGVSRCPGQIRFEAKTPLSQAWRTLDDNLTTARHLFRLRRR